MCFNWYSISASFAKPRWSGFRRLLQVLAYFVKIIVVIMGIPPGITIVPGVIGNFKVNLMHNCAMRVHYRELPLEPLRISKPNAKRSREKVLALSEISWKFRKVVLYWSLTCLDHDQLGPNIPEEALQARAEFYKVLKTWRSAPCHDVSKQVRWRIYLLQRLRNFWEIPKLTGLPVSTNFQTQSRTFTVTWRSASTPITCTRQACGF